MFVSASPLLQSPAVPPTPRVADPSPGSPVKIPDELQAVLEANPEVAALYDVLPPSHQRAWAEYVAEAKRPETRMRRACNAPAGIRARAFPR